MPVLLLAQGDPQAKNLLRQAIEARYGGRPPVIESLRIDFKGRVRAKVGPINTWVPVDATACFRFPNQMRWDFTARPMGVPVRRGVDAFDGTTYRSVRDSGKPATISDEPSISSTRRQLWAIAALLLTPLGEHHVKLTATGEDSFDAANSQINDSVSLHLRPNKTLDHVQVECLNPAVNKQRTFFLRISQEFGEVNELMLPRKVSAFWDDEPFYEVEPVGTQNNIELSQGIFTLEEDLGS
jgi:hypothetical protein